MKVKINGYIVPNEHKPVYDFYGLEAFCPNDIKAAKSGSESEPLEVIIGTCYGGSIFAGSEIGAEIKAHPGGATIDVMGLAASAAGVIAMYAESRMAPTAMMMVHNVSSRAEGDYHVMDKESDILKQCNKAMAAAYVMKTGMSEAEALAMMNKETWLTAVRAKELGLVDAILFENADPDQLVASIGPGMIPKAVIEKTLKMLAEQKLPPAQLAGGKKQFDLARAKLALIEKTL